MTPKLSTETLAKTFGTANGGSEEQSVMALDGVDIAIGAGEFVSVVGPSGCGKSTLFNLLAGLIRPSGGRILLDGREPGDLLGLCGYMHQRDLLMPWRTVLANTTLAMELNGLKRSEARRRALAEFPRFGLEGFHDHWPAKLSGGMRQRAALLRTFLGGNDVMLLDEPFGALDALTRQQMQEWLLEIWQQDRKTILFVTHDVEEAVFLSDRVYVMSGRPGRIVLELEVGLPRPRKHELTLGDEFVALKQRLLEPLQATSQRAPERVSG